MALIDYHKSTSQELLAVTNRVRNLITHWGEDGRYKEAILKNVIKRFLPEKYLIATGFVIKKTGVRGEHISSNQIDLLIYDNEFPVLFKEGDFVIVTPDAIKAIIEVKANLGNQNLKEVIEKCNRNAEFIFSGKQKLNEKLFNGIFSYEGYAQPNMEILKEAILNGNLEGSQGDHFNKYRVNHISFNGNLFLKYWPEEERPNSLYKLKHLSFSFFISNLMDFITNGSVIKNDFIWFANDKELNLLEDF